VKYLIAKNNRENHNKIAHYWDGEDTYCQMYSNGNFRKGKIKILETNIEIRICKLCSKVIDGAPREMRYEEIITKDKKIHSKLPKVKTIKTASEKQLNLLNKKKIKVDPKISRHRAFIEIKIAIEKDKNSPVKEVVFLDKNPACLKLKRFIRSRKIEIDDKITRREAVRIIENFGFQVLNDDTIEKINLTD
jgi:hypothetical protein